MGDAETPALKSRPGLRTVVLVVATVLVFLPVMLQGGFFWDDYELIVRNALVHSGGGLWDFWFTTKNFDYFPLTSTTFWIEWRLWGDWAQPYHVLNVALHIGSALMLWRILERLRVPGAFLAGLVFAIHPVNVESVAWISERKNTLSMFLACVAVLLYLRFEREGRVGVYVGAVGAFLLALLAKTAVVMLPFVLLLLAWHQRGRVTRRDILRAAPFFLVSFLLGVVTIYFQYERSISDIVVRTDSMGTRVATAGWAVWFYLFKAVVPVDLMFNYPRWEVGAWGAVAFVPAILLVAGFVGLFLWRRRVAMAVGGYVLMLLPMLGFLNIFYMRYALVSDHYQYHAVIFVIALIASGVAMWSRRVTAGARRVIGIVVAVCLIGLMVESYSIAGVYRSAESIWVDTLKHNPRSWLAHAQLGEMYLAEGKTNPEKMAEGLRHLQAVTQLRPEMAIGYANLGAGYVMAGEREAAREAFEKGLAAPVSTRLERARIYQGLGSLAATAGDFVSAEKAFREAAGLDGESVSIHYALGATLAAEGKVGEARAELGRALELDPGNAGVRGMLERLQGAGTRP